MRTKGLLFFLVSALFVASCGKGPGTQTPPITTGKTVTLKLFGAYWCTNCHKDLPELQTALRARLGSAISRVKLELWVPTGKGPSDAPTQEIAELYKGNLGLEGKAFVDGQPGKKPPKWPGFKTLFPGIGNALPAGAIVNDQGTVVKKFPPGQDSFVPADIALAVAEAIGK